MKSGFVILDKPSGMTSRQAGWRVAKMFGQRKFGHIGTLDPMASGVLPIALGEATKMIPYIERNRNKVQESEKEYEFGIKWGIETDTGDTDGNIIEQQESPLIPNPESLIPIFAELIGEIEQTPPAYSAIKIGGRKAYELARAGHAVEMPKRQVVIEDLGIRNQEPSIRYYVKCSAGTYVRTIVQQIVERLNKSLIPDTWYLATCDMIRRTQSNGFEIKDSIALDLLENIYNNSAADAEKYLRPVDFGLDDILVLELNEMDAMRFANGQTVTSNQLSVTSGLIRIYNNDKFIGIGKLESGLLKAKRVINNN